MPRQWLVHQGSCCSMMSVDRLLSQSSHYNLNKTSMMYGQGIMTWFMAVARCLDQRVSMSIGIVDFLLQPFDHKLKVTWLFDAYNNMMRVEDVDGKKHWDGRPNASNGCGLMKWWWRAISFLQEKCVKM